MPQDLLLVKSVTGGTEAFFSSDEINGYNLTRDVPLPSLPVLTAWVKERGFTAGHFDLDRSGPEKLVAAARDYDVIGFYLSYSSHFAVMDAVRAVKQAYPAKKIAVGGPSIINLKADFFRLSRKRFGGLITERFGQYVDFAVYGEGEPAIETILRHRDSPDEVGRLVDSGAPSAHGIIYRDRNGNIHASDKPAMVEDLNTLPTPDFTVNDGLIPVAFIETARGCAYRCPFCEMPAIYTKRRVKEQAQVEREIDRIQELGIRHVVITDPSIYPEQRMEMLSEIFTGRGMEWTGYARPGTWRGNKPFYSRDTLRRARESGCVSLFFGGESASERTQEMYGKPRPAILREMESICKEVGIRSCWSFMILSPGESRDDVDRLIAFLKELAPDMLVFSPFAVMPDSEMDRTPEKFHLDIRDPDYKLRAPEMYAKFSKSAGLDSRRTTRQLLHRHPALFRFLIRRKMGKTNYFRNTETGLDFADGAFEMLRVDDALRDNTSINVGKSNYHLMFENAARA